MKKIKGYIFSRPFFDERAPQHIQNIIIREFCKKEKLHYNLSAVEYAMSNSHKTLYQLINDLKNLDGIVAYSVFQLPIDNIEKRKEELEQAIMQSKQLVVDTQNKINALSGALQQCDLFISEIQELNKDQTYNDVNIDDVANEEGESDGGEN